MPFVKTALLPVGPESQGENIIHFTAVRMRVVGGGSLNMALYSQDNIYSQALVPFTMNATTNIQPTRLSNFIHQRASLRISTNTINEWFKINRIIVFVNEFATSYPG
jgi:hypothetical protein